MSTAADGGGPTAQPAGEVVPTWFDAVAVGGPLVLLSVGLVALPLAIIGRYSLALVLTLSVPAALVLVLGATHRLAGHRSSPGRPANGWACAVLVLALAAGLVNSSRAAQHVIVDSDPGSYATTARWISGDGDLVVELPPSPFDDVDWIGFESEAVYDTSSGLEFQFNHFASSVLAVARDVGGDGAMFSLPAWVGAWSLLPIFSFSSRLSRRPWLGAATCAAFAATLPFIAFVRDTYSEPFVAALLWAGLLLLGLTLLRVDPWLSACAGALIGATTMTRVDAVLYLMVVPFAAAVFVRRGGRGRKAAAALCAAAAVTYGIGAADLWWRSGRYGADLASERLRLDLLLLAAIVLAVAGSVLTSRRAALMSRLWRLVGRLALPVGIGAVVALLLAWWVRPLVQETHQSVVAPWGTRTYAEEAVHWLSWYLGPIAVGLAIAGIGRSLTTSLRRQAGTWTALLVGSVLPVAAIYLWRPSISPFHIWAMRRFMPSILPGMLLFAAVAVTWLLARREATQLPPIARTALAVVAALALVVPPLTVSWPLRNAQDRRNYLGVVLDACDAMPDDAVVLLLNRTWAQSLRGWCGYDVALVGGADPDAAELSALADAWALECRELYLVADNPGYLDPYSSVTGPLSRSRIVLNDRALVQSFDGPPGAYERQVAELVSAQGPRRRALCAGLSPLV